MISTTAREIDPFGEIAITRQGGKVEHYRKNVVIEFPEGTRQVQSGEDNVILPDGMKLIGPTYRPEGKIDPRDFIVEYEDEDQ